MKGEITVIKININNSFKCDAKRTKTFYCHKKTLSKYKAKK